MSSALSNKSAPINYSGPPPKKSEQLRNLLLLPTRQQHAILKTGINPCVLGFEKGERREGEQRAGSRGKLKLVSYSKWEFESCSHEYHHLLGSEVTGNFCRDCMRFARKKLPLVGRIVAPLTAPLGPCARTHALTHCQVTSCYRVSCAILSAQGYCCDHICSCGLNLVERLLQHAHITIETKCFLSFFFILFRLRSHWLLDSLVLLRLNQLK